MSLNFFKHFVGVKAGQADEALVNFAANIDPEAVSEVAVKQMEEKHAEYVKQLAAAQTDFKREKQDYLDIKVVYDKKMNGAERAQADLDKDPNNTEAAAALSELLDSIEKMMPKLEKEEREYKDAERLMHELDTASNEVAQELLQLREILNQSKADLKTAQVDAERQKQNLEKAKVLAGLKTSGDKFDAAKNALQKRVEQTQQAANESRIAAEQLRKPVVTVSAAASKYLDDAPAASTETLQERMARLKAKV
jgi:DNA repair exonuclease SbcCD ATPase subunit